MSRTRRNTELALLLALVPVALLLFALVHGGAGAEFDLIAAAVPAGLIAAFLVAHSAVRLLAPDADPVLLPVAALCTLVGVAFITRLDADRAAAQLVWVMVGLVAMVATLAGVRSLERLGRYKYTIALAGLVLLVLPAMVGVEVNGARLWLRVAGLSFQPAEVAKILLVVFLAAYLAERRDLLSISTRRVAGLWYPPARHLGPLVLMWLVSLFVLVAEKDLGSSLLFFGVFLAMIHIATGRPAYTVTGLALFAVGATGAYLAFAHVQNRIAIWLRPFDDPADRGYQLVQSLFSLAAGGVTGTGIGRGLPTRIPFVETDFIFTAIAEELGLLGGAALLVAYLVFCFRGLAIAARARTDMAALTAAGLVAVVALQVFVIVGGVTRLIPLTGITLPFVSYGGSSILANFILLALLLRAGDDAVAEEEAARGSTAEAAGRATLARRLRWTGAAVALLIGALVANLTWVQVGQARELAAHPANTRDLVREMRQERGAIVSSDGVVLARSVEQEDGTYGREYPQGDLGAHVVGYADPRFGRAGIESAMHETLLGRRDVATFRDAVEAAAGIPVRGNDVVLTLHGDVQRVAESVLEGRAGAVVALDPGDGSVLAMASSPTFSPEDLSERWDALAADESAPLLNRALSGLYPPGSTFKVVTLTAALRSETVAATTSYPGTSPIEIGGGRVTNYGGASYGDVTVEQALVSSINTVFAQIAVDVGAPGLVGQARDFGFGAEPPVRLPTDPSLMPDPDLMAEWELAWAGVGQPVGERDDVGPVATPLQMALVAAGIANDGEVPAPRVVARVTDPAGRTLSESAPAVWKTACEPEVADEVTRMMVRVVEAGTGRAAALPGVTVAGKTGTAEIGEDRPTHAWFIAFAPAEDPRVAVAVILEEAGTGGSVAAPAAAAVMSAALEVVR